MTEAFSLLLAACAGIALGGIFFGGLWWTVRQATLSSVPAIWFLGSLLLRMAIVLAGFYFVALGDWKRLAICLLGFVTARIAVMYVTRPRAVEAHHAT